MVLALQVLVVPLVVAVTGQVVRVDQQLVLLVILAGSMLCLHHQMQMVGEIMDQLLHLQVLKEMDQVVVEQVAQDQLNLLLVVILVMVETV
jgi:hypothetical protein|tara:strand:- start:212 stop:484 length:273 start_codon:yes stop_codon:yes gene_type:complete